MDDALYVTREGGRRYVLRRHIPRPYRTPRVLLLYRKLPPGQALNREIASDNRIFWIACSMRRNALWGRKVASLTTDWLESTLDYNLK